mgnify:CR=1 FL=1
MASDTLNLDKIERLARAATPGPWVREPHGGRRISEPGGYAICYVEMDDDVALTESDAAYIAHMHPARVLALVERARERDALARRMRVVCLHVVAYRRSDGTYWLDYPSGRIAPVICTLNDDARSLGYWPTASAALDAAATALEKAGLMGEGRDA